jgi:release factor glutamine methyltransferase
MNLAAALDRATVILESAGVPAARVDAELLVGHILGISRGGVQARVATDAAIGTDEAIELTEFVERRAAREPLQHITGVAYFRLVQHAVDALRAVATPEPLAVDLGTGSGAIALALATEVPHSRVYGVEVSPRAYVWARQNFRSVGADNATPVFHDLAGALPELDGLVDVVISNPPYIPTGAIPRDPEVRLHDPELALYGGEDGLDVVRQVSQTAARLLHSGGTLVLEHGELQSAAIAELLARDGWRAIAHHRDLTGRDRATTALR